MCLIDKTARKMTSVKVKYRPSSVDDKEGSIYYQIIHDRMVRQLNTHYHILLDEWDEKRSMVIARHGSNRSALVLSIRERIHRDVDRLTKIVKQLDAKGLIYSADDVIDEFRRYEKEYTLFNYIEKLIIKFKQNGKLRTSETYSATLNSFKKFRKDDDIMLDCLSSEIMEAFEAWHKQKGNSPNTISFYTRILRAAYNRAVEDNIIDNRYPFRHVYTGVDKTTKRALPLTIIKKIKSFDLSLYPSLDYARDMFMLSFYLRGMSFIDMAYLKKADLKGGSIVYRRRKTGQQLTIAWTPEMQALLNKYPPNPTQYLLPIIKTAGCNERCAYRNAGYNINHNLKKIAEMVGIQIPITMYVARHSWASAAKAKGIPLSIISEGMGHDSEATTRIYLASLDTSVVDQANNLIISSL